MAEPANRLKLLVLASDFPPMTGGIATCAWELATALHQRGDLDLRIIARRPTSVSERAEIPDVPTLRVGISTNALVASFQFKRVLHKMLIEWKPDAVLNFLWLPEGAGCNLAHAKGGKKFPPYYIVAHGVELLESTSNFKKRVRGWLAPFKARVLRGAAGIFCVSRYTQRLLETQCGVSIKRTTVIHNGVDATRFSPGIRPESLVRRHGLEGKTVFLTITRLVDYKGIDMMMRSLAKVIEFHPECVYLIGGEGTDRARLENLARELGIFSRVVFIGAVPTVELVDYYRVCDCFVMLSREDLITPNVEGFGIVYLEAAACERPVIAGNSGGVADAVADGETGWLVDPNDVKSIVSAVTDFLNNRSESTRRGKNGRQRVIDSFTWGGVAQRVFEELKRR